MQRLEVSGAVRPIYGSLGVKLLMLAHFYCLECVIIYECSYLLKTLCDYSVITLIVLSFGFFIRS